MPNDLPTEGTIEVRIRDLSQLFNSLDPSPFHERDLDDDAEDYIVSWARELPAHVRLRLVIHMPPAEAQKAVDRKLEQSIAHYFEHRAEKYQRDLRELFRNGRRYLAIGLSVLTGCLLASHVLRNAFGTGAVVIAVTESLSILGWVANWKPLETFLYDSWPIRRRIELYRRLERAEIEIRAG